VKLFNLKQIQTWAKVLFALGFFNACVILFFLTCGFASIWLMLDSYFIHVFTCAPLTPFLSFADVFPPRMNEQNLRVISVLWLTLSLLESCIGLFLGRLSVWRLFQILGQSHFKNTVALLILAGALAQPNYRASYFLLAFLLTLGLAFYQINRYLKSAKQGLLQKA
jgi:hypothetical protein